MTFFLRAVHWLLLGVAWLLDRCLIAVEERRFRREERGTFASPAPVPATAADFNRLTRKYPTTLGRYYRGRWLYMRQVVRIIREESPQSVLEIGPRWIPLVKGSDLLDKEPKLPQVTYRHDAERVPWPVESGRYDLVIALQVWEHLGDRQQEAFREVMRIGRSAILSFPYKWNCPGDPHHMIDEKVIGEWTLHRKPKRVIRAGVRIIYHFDLKSES